MSSEPEDNRAREEKYCDPIRDECFKEREELRSKVAELEQENDRLRAVKESLEVLKDPNQELIPWDKVKADFRIKELEEALQQEHERAEKLASAYSADGHGLRKRIQQLQEALRFYADEENWLESEDPEHPNGYWIWLGTGPIAYYENAEGPAIAQAALSRQPSEASQEEKYFPGPMWKYGMTDEEEITQLAPYSIEELREQYDHWWSRGCSGEAMRRMREWERREALSSEASGEEEE